MEMVNIKVMICPSCGAPLNSAAEMTDTKKFNGPQPGMLGLCHRCAGILLYISEGHVELIPEELYPLVEMKVPHLWQQIMTTQRLIREEHDKT